MRKLIQGGTVVNASETSVADVLVEGEEIVAVGSLGDVDAEVIDASGCYVLPGLIDNDTHMAMPFGGTHSIDDYDEHSRVGARHGAFVSDEICDRFCVLGSPEQAAEKLRELESIGVDQFNIYLMTEGQEETLETYGREIIPRFAGVTGGAT